MMANAQRAVVGAFRLATANDVHFAAVAVIHYSTMGNRTRNVVLPSADSAVTEP
jgi:hypothetical protein